MSPPKVCCTKVGFAAMLIWALSGCASMHPLPAVNTHVLEFVASPEINNKQMLPVDILYIHYAQELRKVVRYGPEFWFESDFRESWVQKESIAIQGGQRIKVELAPEIMKRTKLIVIFADYKNVTDPGFQQVIVDYAGEKSETIYVKPDRLMPTNKSLRYLE